MQLFIGKFNENIAQLTEEESKHFSKVLRGKIGQTIYVIDGKGNFAKGNVFEISSKSVFVKINQWLETNKRNYKLHIAIAPTKSIDRIEYFLEKATEIGIDEITFLHCFHSERKNIKLERCQRIVLSAVKQSLKSHIPKLNDLTRFSDFIKQDFNCYKLIAHCEESFQRSCLKDQIEPQKDYLILIGPEGDFSKEEIETAIQNGFSSISLGEQRFRTETAALNAVFGLNWIN